MATVTSLGFNIKSNWDGTGVKAAVSDLQLLQEEMRRVSGAALKVDVVVDTDGPNGIGAARRELDLLEEKMRRINGAGLQIHVHVDGMDEISQAQLRLEALNAEARNVRIGFELNMFEYQAAEIKIAKLVRDRTINIDIDGSGIGDGVLQITNNIHHATKASEDFQTRATRAMVMVRLAMVAVLAAAGVLPAAITAIGAAFAVLPGIIGVALGGALLSRVQAVKDSFTGLKNTILEIGDDAVKPMVGPVLDAVERMKTALWGMQPAIREMFASSANLVRPLSDTLIAFAQRVMPGVNDMLRESVPLFNGIQEGVKNFATSISRMFSAMSGATEDFGMTWNILFTYLGRIMEAFGYSSARMAKNVNESLGDSMRSFEGFIRGALDGLEGFAAATGAANNGLAIFSTLGDMLRIIIPAWGNLYAAIGGAESGLNNFGVGIATFVAGAMNSLSTVVKDIMPYINDFAFYIKKGFDAINEITPAIGPMVAALYGVKTVLTLIGKNPLVALVLAIVGVIGYLYDLEQRTGAVSRFITDAWNKIGPVVMPVVNTIRDGVNGIVDAFNSAGGATGVWDKIVNAVQPVLDVIKSLIDTYMPQIKGIGTSWAEAFAPFWDKIEPSISKLGDAFESAWPRIQTVLVIIGAAIGATFGGILGVIKNVAGPVSEVLVTIFNGVVGVITSIVDVISGLIQFLSGIVGIFVNVGKAVAAIFTGNGEAFKNALGGIWDSVQQVFGGITNTLQGMAGIIANIWNTIVGLFKNGVGFVIGIVTGFIEGVINFFTHMWDVLVGHSIVPDMINAIIKWFTELPGKVIAMVRQWIIDIIAFFVELASKVVAAWQDWIAKVLSAWETFSSFLRAGWDAMWAAIRDFVQNIWNGIKAAWDFFINSIRQAFEAWRDLLTGFWSAMWNGIRDAAVAIWNFIVDRWNNFIDNIKAVYEAFKSFLTDAWNNLWNGIKTVAENIWTGITDGFTKFKDGVTNTIEGLVTKVKEIWDRITGVFEGPINGIKGIWNGVAGAFGLPELAIGGPVGDPVRRADGGSIRGKGTGTSDDIPALLSNGEHVWTAREVDAVGGHNAMAQMRQDALRGAYIGEAAAFATGGPALQWMVGQQQVHAPAVGLTSGVRNGDPGYHGSGQAGDFSNGGDAGTPQMKAFAEWIASTWGKNSLELIHRPFGHNIKNGQDVGDGVGLYGESTMAGHRNHVHWAVSNALNDDQMGSAVPGSGGVAVGPTPAQIAQITAAKDKIREIAVKSQNDSLSALSQFQLEYAFKGVGKRVETPRLGTDIGSNADILGNLGVAQVVPPTGATKNALASMGKLDTALAAMTSVGSNGPIGGVIPEGERRAIIEKALSITNTPPPSTQDAWLAGMNTLITRESNWNAGAKNDWDSNAAAGNNSVGLAQVIPPTFAANKAPGYDNIYGAVDNVAASINYIKSRYGTIENVQQANANMPPKGYAAGTRNAGAGWSMVGEQGPEMVKFSGGETVKTFDEIITALKSSASGEANALRTRLSTELDACFKKLIDANKLDSQSVKSSLETAIERAVALTGMKVDITTDSVGNTDELIRQLTQQLLPQLTKMLAQGVGSRV